MDAGGVVAEADAQDELEERAERGHVRLDELVEVTPEPVQGVYKEEVKVKVTTKTTCRQILWSEEKGDRTRADCS